MKVAFSKRYKVAAVLMMAGIALAAVSLSALAGEGKRDMVPNVAFLAPEDESTIDLTGKTGITFKWKNAPIPAGGRDSYRFKLIKGFNYDFVVSQELGQGVFSIDVPADKFEDGVTYSWYVEQRDASLMIWGRHDTVWSFKVIKKP